MTSADSPQSTYDGLRNRASEFIAGAGGQVREEELIAFIFGTSQRPEMWRTLLMSVLGGDGRFVQTAHGTWHLSTAVVESDVGLSFVALDVETTGLRPNEHRIIEIGIARYANGRCMDRYSALINPERRIPDYIRKLTGISDSDLIPAPVFKSVASDILTFIGDHAIVGHNVGFDIGFVNAELRRLDLPPLTNASIDTVPMAMRVLGRRVRPSLDRVAHALGMPSRDKHRALGDAELTAAVALRMLAMAREQGESIESFVSTRSSTGAFLPPPRSQVPATLDRALLGALPRRPGVYIMYDAGGHILYVGKAKSLRDRVASYFSQPLGYTRKMDGLIENIRRIEHEETGSELVALLLEAQLIRRHQPPYNRMLRNSDTYPYIRFDVASKWPRLRLAKKPSRDGARYFGPFRSRATARDAVEILSRRYKLRTCARSFKTPASYGNPCLELDLHRCPGPCVGRADPDAYRGAVNATLELLTADEPSVLASFDDEIAAAVDLEQFELAQRLRHQRDVLERLHREQRALTAFDIQQPYCIVQPASSAGKVQVLIVVQGRWWGHLIESPEQSNLIAGRIEESWRRFEQVGLGAIDHQGVDEATILARWSALPAAQPYIVPIGPDFDWQRVAEAIAQIANQGANDLGPHVVAYDASSGDSAAL